MPKVRCFFRKGLKEEKPNVHRSYRFITAVIALLFVLSIALVGCSASFTTANLSEFALATKVDQTSMKPVTVVSKFKQSDPVLYVTTKLANAPDDTKIKFAWYYKDTAGDQEIDTVEVNAGGERYLSSNLAMPSGKQWPKGSYYVKFYVDDKEVKTLDFTVE
jgi:hypothetical protein